FFDMNRSATDDFLISSFKVSGMYCPLLTPCPSILEQKILSEEISSPRINIFSTNSLMKALSLEEWLMNILSSDIVKRSFISLFHVYIVLYINIRNQMKKY